jgi:hypothetical protein
MKDVMKRLPPDSNGEYLSSIPKKEDDKSRMDSVDFGALFSPRDQKFTG